MSEINISYDPQEWSRNFITWFADYADIGTRNVKVTQVSATGGHKLQFNVEHTAHHIDYANLCKNMLSEFSPLSRLISASGNKLSFGVIPLDSKSASALYSTFEKVATTIRRRDGKKLAYGLLAFFTVNTVVACVLLHNHWHFYDEPWHGVLDFFKYHARLYL